MWIPDAGCPTRHACITMHGPRIVPGPRPRPADQGASPVIGGHPRSPLSESSAGPLRTHALLPREPWRRNQVAVTIAAAMVFLGFTLVTPFLPFYIQTLRSEEHTSELQSLAYLVCRLLLEKKKKKNKYVATRIMFIFEMQ